MVTIDQSFVTPGTVKAKGEACFPSSQTLDSDKSPIGDTPHLPALARHTSVESVLTDLYADITKAPRQISAALATLNARLETYHAQLHREAFSTIDGPIPNALDTITMQELVGWRAGTVTEFTDALQKKITQQFEFCLIDQLCYVVVPAFTGHLNQREFKSSDIHTGLQVMSKALFDAFITDDPTFSMEFVDRAGLRAFKDRIAGIYNEYVISRFERVEERGDEPWALKQFVRPEDIQKLINEAPYSKEESATGLKPFVLDEALFNDVYVSRLTEIKPVFRPIDYQEEIFTNAMETLVFGKNQ